MARDHVQMNLLCVVEIHSHTAGLVLYSQSRNALVLGSDERPVRSTYRSITFGSIADCYDDFLSACKPSLLKE